MKPRVRSVHKNIVISIKPQRGPSAIKTHNKLLASYQTMVRESTIFSSPRITAVELVWIPSIATIIIVH